MGLDAEILLDTHARIWWVHRDPLLPAESQAVLEPQPSGSLGVSAISLWEVAKLIERNRLELPLEPGAWMDMALGGSDVLVIELTPAIAIASANLPQPFHRDPADQLIVATSRTHDIPLVTLDGRIRAYPHVRLLTGSRLHDR